MKVATRAWCLRHRPSPIERGPVADRLIRTPAMQAGLAKKRLSFRDIFTVRPTASQIAVVRSHGVLYHESTMALRRGE